MIHKICDLYKNIYLLSPKLSKRDRFGIYLKIENICLDIMDLTIEAALESKLNKLPLALAARVKIEKLKRFFRILFELNIIEKKNYISFQSNLQEISRDMSNWIKYLKNLKTNK